MATPQNYSVDLEAAASRRINPFLKGLTMLTGGLAGEFTGTNEQIRERNRARQALLKEEMDKRDEQRMLERQLMVNALQQGIAAPEGATLEEKMADFNRKKIRKEIAAGEGRVFGYGQTMGPFQSQADPAFQIAATESQAEAAKRAAELRQKEELEKPELAAQLSAFGVPVPEGASAGQLRGLVDVTRMRTQSRIPTEEAGKRAMGELQTFEQRGFYKPTMDLTNMTPEQLIAESDIVGRQYAESQRVSAFQKREQAEQNAVRGFMQEAAKEAPDQAKLQEMFYALPVDAQKDARNRQIAGVTSVATPKEREQLTKYSGLLSKAQTLVGNISELAKSEDLSKVSQDNFNGFTSWLRGVTNKYGTEDPKVALLNDIVQQFEQVVAGTRKDLFGASLTGNELVSARSQFGDPNSANFLRRMITFLDGVLTRDVVQEDFKDFGIQVPQALEKRTKEARDAWMKAREGFNFGGKRGASSGVGSSSNNAQIKQLRDELNMLRSALTNAPSATR
jgi:hypothetical protein